MVINKFLMSKELDLNNIDFEKCRRSGTFLPEGRHFRDPNAISRTIVFIF